MQESPQNKVPLYQELHDRLVDDLANGVYPVGQRFPTEQELCAKTGLGRHTVREALKMLQDAGLLSRRAGAGTVVLARTTPKKYSYRVDSIENLTRYAEATVFEIQQEGFVTLHKDFAETLGVQAGSRWLRIAGLRRPKNDEQPLAWTEIYIAQAYVEVRKGLGVVSRPIYQEISEHFGFGISKVERQTTAVTLPHEMSEQLHSQAGTPALMERRRYWSDNDEVFEVSMSFHPGDRFSQTIMLERET